MIKFSPIVLLPNDSIYRATINEDTKICKMSKKQF